MTKFTERQLERRFCALEKRRDDIRKCSQDERHSRGSRMALARASDALTEALLAIKFEATKEPRTAAGSLD